MYFSVITLKHEGSLAAVGRAVADGGYGVHELIWSFFPAMPKGTPCPVHRFDPKPLPQFHVVSERKPLDTSGHWEVRSKEYDPKLTTGDRLDFAVRLNPVVTRHDEQGRHKRHDIVMDIKKSLKMAGQPRKEWPSTSEIWQQAASAWLRARYVRHGFDFRDADIRVDGYMPTRMWRRKQTAPIQITTLEVSGLLTVTDPGLFRDMLFHGLGPAKGFGCGLVLVKRASG